MVCTRLGCKAIGIIKLEFGAKTLQSFPLSKMVSSTRSVRLNSNSLFVITKLLK